jgi:hypothetical protein
MKNKLKGLVDGLTLFMLISIVFREFNELNYEAGVGWTVATLYFIITLMHKWSDHIKQAK